MTTVKLSPLAEKLLKKLNEVSHLMSIETMAYTLYEDTTLSNKRRRAYLEIYEYAANNIY